MSFKEFISEEFYGKNYSSKKEEINKLLKSKFSKNYKGWSALGSSIDLRFEYNSKKEAENPENVEKILKVLNTLVKVKLNVTSKDYKGGKIIQSSDWEKDSPEDKHELYISFI